MKFDEDSLISAPKVSLSAHEDEMMESNRLGLHLMQIDGDILFFKWVGNFAPGNVREVQTLMQGMLGAHDFIFLLVDATAARSIEPEARRMAASWPYFHRLGGAAIFGAGLTIRTLVTITLAIRRYLFPRNKAMPIVKFVNTEAAARSWIDAQRREILFTENHARAG